MIEFTGMPKISVCLTTYNGAAYVAETIEKALAQDYDDFELLISDNGSTDKTVEICHSFTSPRIRFFSFTDGRGQAANTNFCVSQARGEFVALLCHDDYHEQSFLSRMAAALDSNRDVGLVYCAAKIISPEGTAMGVNRTNSHDFTESGKALIRRLLLDGCVVNPSGNLFRRSLWDSVGGFSDKIVWGVDRHLWIRLAIGCSVSFIADTLVAFRDHPMSGTARVMLSGGNSRDEVWLLEDAISRMPADWTDLRDLRDEGLRSIAHRTWCIAEQLSMQGFREAARAQLRSAAGVAPSIMLESRFMALWATTFFGYGWLKRLRDWKR